MQACKIGVDEARDFFRHPSQQKGAMILPEDLPEFGFEYWASGPICGAFHPAPWPGLWFAHYGVMPAGWGRLKDPATAIMRAFCDASGARALIGWTDSKNRAAIAFARRLGFQITGTMDGGAVTISEWRP